MTSPRYELSDDQWDLIREFLPANGRRGQQWKDHRTVIDGILWALSDGGRWRNLPERFGKWKTVFNRFSNWSQRGHWAAIFKALQIRVDEDGVIIDASVIRAHQDSAGGKGGSSAMHWVVLEVESPPKFTPSSTRRAAPSTSKSRRGSSTSPRSPNNSSSTRKARP